MWWTNDFLSVAFISAYRQFGVIRLFGPFLLIMEFHINCHRLIFCGLDLARLAVLNVSISLDWNNFFVN